MNIKPMLKRFESAMGCQDLTEQMVLLQPPPELKSTQALNIVVGYKRSSSSQMALDVALWIAHQTRLATQKQVTVQVVYVLNNISSERSWMPLLAPEASASNQLRSEELSATPRATLIDPSCFRAIFYQNHQFEQADRILWQARSLASEWGGSFKAHLRFGRVATELRRVVESEAADLVFLGCDSVAHPVVQELGSDFPCPVLGIPSIVLEEI